MSPQKKICDAAIAGAGPAGSSLAIRLARAGMHVLLVEQKKFPREKLCGEFISPECLSHFAELGVISDIAGAGGADLVETLFFTRNGKGISVKSEWFDSADSMAQGLSRAEMDSRLIEYARSSGVDVREETNVIGLGLDNGKVSGIRIKSLNTDRVEIHSAITIDATGRSRSLVRRLHRNIVDRKAARLVAFKTHLSNAKLRPGACEIYSYRGGYGGCNRVENDLFNLCFIASAADTKRMESDPERVMREIVFTNKRAAEAMSDARIVKPWLAVPIERFGRGELVPANGLLTVGDAAAFIDPFTGSGMLMALESSKIAANSIIKCRNDFAEISDDYSKHYASVFNRRLRVCSILRYAAFVPFLAETTISALGISSRLRRRVALATRFSGEQGV